MPELMRRHVVMAMATEAPFDLADPEGVFVLKPWKDPAALRALRTYCDNCYPELARDLEGWIRAIEGGPAVRGDVGRRNEAHLRPAAAPRGPRRRVDGPRSRPHRSARPEPAKPRPARKGKKRRR
jgi:hypothetical protein